MRIALSIAASDPTGGAGLQADLQVFRSLGVHGAGVVTALTVQDTAKVHSVLPVFPSVVLDQLRALLADVTPHAIKIGALASDDVVRNVLLAVGSLARQVPMVVDPILFSSSGASLLERRAWTSLAALIDHCALVTPNLPEAEALTGCDVSTRAGTERAARFFLSDLGAGAVLVKGGHRDATTGAHAGDPADGGTVADLLATRDGESDFAFRWLEGRRIDAGPVHGTGCMLSSAVAAELARGETLVAAVEKARGYVAAAIANADAVGSGARLLVYP